MTIQIEESLFERIQRHAEQSYPEEGAGLILGDVNGEIRTARRILAFPNRFQAGSRHHRYLIEPEDMLKAEQEAERDGLDVIAVFHSHPDHPPDPSEFDRSWALPWYFYLITSVVDGKAIETRNWSLAPDRDSMIEELINLQPDSRIQEV